MFGSLDWTDGVAEDMANETGMIVVAVGYRLAPEFTFPTPVKVGARHGKPMNDRSFLLVEKGLLMPRLTRFSGAGSLVLLASRHEWNGLDASGLAPCA